MGRVRTVRQVGRSAAVLAVAALVVGLAVACTGGDSAEPGAYQITAEPIGHWHIFGAKQLQFTVHDAESEQGVSGLNLVVQIAQAGSSRVSERSVEDGDVIDEGNGVYSVEYAPSSIGAYSVVARFVHEGQAFVAQPVAFEVAKGGEEGIRVDAGGNSYVYQVRYHWDPGHGHASDTEPVKLLLEIMRGIPEGDAINWEQPWQNAFDHVTDADHMEIVIRSEDGAVVEELHTTYQGQGVYEVQRIFSVAEVGDGQEYTVHCSFTDPYNGAHVGHSEPFALHISAPH